MEFHKYKKIYQIGHDENKDIFLNPDAITVMEEKMDEGMKLDLKMMSELPKRVLTDIYEEHWKEILTSNWKIDFKSVRKLVPRRCLAVLKQIMVNNAIGGQKWM